MGAIGLLWYLLSLAFIVIVGVLKLEQPFGRDQAIHHWLALRVLDGATPYRDAWDVKQPAILAFHALAAALFGPSVRAVHLLELGWMLGLAVLMMVLLRGYFRHRWLSAAAPAAAIVPYYVFAEPYSQTQVEIMVALPLFVTAWSLWRAAENEHRRVGLALLAGLAAGFATAFKHVLAPIPVGFVLIATLFMLRRPRTQPVFAALGSLWLPFALGVIVVWGAISLGFLIHGGFADFFWTNFLWPLENLHITEPAPVSRLMEGGLVLLASMAPWTLLALVSLGGLWRTDEPPLTALLWSWIAVGFAVILIQPTSWWAYHFLLLYVPLGILGVRGVDRITDGLTQRGSLSAFAAMGLSALLVLLPLAGLARPVGEEARTYHKAFLVDHMDADTFRRAHYPDYASAATVADYLNAAGGNDPLYVVDDLNMLLLTHRDIGLPVPGQWLAAIPLPQRWEHIPEELQHNPPRFFFLEQRLADKFAARYPALMTMLEHEYRVVLTTPFGRLFEYTQPSPQQSPLPQSPESPSAPVPPSPTHSPATPASLPPVPLVPVPLAPVPSAMPPTVSAPASAGEPVVAPTMKP